MVRVLALTPKGTTVSSFFPLDLYGHRLEPFITFLTYLWGWFPMSALRSFFHKRRISSFEEEPEARKDVLDYSKFHVISGDDPNSAVLTGEVLPAVRSGHRTFLTEDYLYVIGGFDSVNGGTIYKDVWRMNLLTLKWTKMHIADDNKFPQALASFALCQLAPYSDRIVLYGGTDLPFGEKSSSSTYVLSMGRDGTVTSEELDVASSLHALYGHAMIRNDEAEHPTFYSIGGTTGRFFYLDVDCLSFKEKQWRWNKHGNWHGLGGDNEPEGLYRFECVIDKGKIIMLGGGTPDVVQSFERVYTFDMKKKTYGHQVCLGDPDHGFPIGRRCHSATQWGRKVVVIGGCSPDMHDPDHIRRVTIYGDVWILDLDTFQWRKHHSDLDTAVFFHSAAITKDGCLLVHGGVADEMSRLRLNTVQAMWLSPPRLLHITSRVVLTNMQSKRPKGILPTAFWRKTLKFFDPPDFYLSKPMTLAKHVLFPSDLD